MTTTVEACIQQIPPDHTGTHNLEINYVEVTAENYLTAVAKAEADLPAGWRVLYVRTLDHHSSNEPPVPH